MPEPLADHKQITKDRLLAFPRESADAIRYHRLYAKGQRSNLVLTDRERVYLQGILKSRFTDNICNLIIATASDRLVLEGFQVEDKGVQTWLDEDLYIKNRIGALNGDTHYATLRDGNYCLYPWWSARRNRIIIFREEWWDGKSGIYVHYDEEDQIKYAVKEWIDPVRGSVRMRTVWFEGQMERYESTEGRDWKEYVIPGETAAIIPLLKADGAPLGIPIIHFANGGRGPSNYGDSELDGGPEGFQDQIDHLHYSITMTARNTGFQTTWSSGVSKAVDEEGNEVKLENGPGAHWMGPTGSQFGHIPAGSIKEQIEAYHLKRGSVCHMTRTPLHYITGNWPSGEALYRAELPLVDKVTKQREKVDPAWTTLAHRATEIANIYGKLGLNEEAMIGAVFADVERRDPFTLAAAEQAQANAAQAWIEAGRPLSNFLREKGWSEDKLQQLEEDKQAEDEGSNEMMQRQLTAFERGR